MKKYAEGDLVTLERRFIIDTNRFEERSEKALRVCLEEEKKALFQKESAERTLRQIRDLRIAIYRWESSRGSLKEGAKK